MILPKTSNGIPDELPWPWPWPEPWLGPCPCPTITSFWWWEWCVISGIWILICTLWQIRKNQLHNKIQFSIYKNINSYCSLPPKPEKPCPTLPNVLPYPPLLYPASVEAVTTNKTQVNCKWANNKHINQLDMNQRMALYYNVGNSMHKIMKRKKCKMSEKNQK